MKYHWHIHIHDASKGFEPAKHPRARGRFSPGGGEETEAEEPGHSALPVSTGKPVKDKRKKRRARDSRQVSGCTGGCDGTSQCRCRGAGY
jgi:hypothetical protein